MVFLNDLISHKELNEHKGIYGARKLQGMTCSSLLCSFQDLVALSYPDVSAYSFDYMAQPSVRFVATNYVPNKLLIKQITISLTIEENPSSKIIAEIEETVFFPCFNE